MKPSHVLLAMNVPMTTLKGAIRMTLSRENTQGEVDRVLRVLPEIISKLRATSRLWRARARPEPVMQVSPVEMAP